MNGATMTSWQYLINGPIAGWTIVGTGDFNGDGKTDILWENPNAGVTVWFMNGATMTSWQYLINGPTGAGRCGTRSKSPLRRRDSG